MNVRSASRLACLFVLTGLIALVLSTPAQGVVFSFGQHPDKERLVFQFPNPLPEYSVQRTDMRELALRVPRGGMGGPGALPDFAGSRLVSGLRATDGGVDIALRTDAVGFVAFTLDNPPRLVVDVFSDPLGARWKPTGAPLREPRAAAPKGPVRTAANRTEPARAAPRAIQPQAAAPAATGGVAPVAAKVEPKVAPARADIVPDVPQDEAAQQLPRMRAAAGADTAPVAPAPVPEEAVRKRTNYQVPSVFRGKVTPPGQTAPAQAERVPQENVDAALIETPAPPAGADASVPPAGAETGALQDAPERQAAEPVEAAPVPDKPGRFMVAKPGQAQPPVAAGAVPGAETPAATQKPKRPKPAPPAADSEPLKREVVERVTENLLGGDEPPSHFRGRVFKAGDEMPSPAPSAEAPLPQPPAEQAPVPVASADKAAPDAEAPMAEGDAVAGGEAAQNATAEAQAQARQEKLDEIMFAARTAQGAEQYDTALEELNLLMRQPDVSAEMAEEAMYMKADVLSTKYREDLESNFDEVNGAYESAINNNLESWRVPAALLKRGVLNLKVGNIPEAAAFFRILREKYEGDPNVPLTYYYWGDYYFNKGDYQKAADEFQYLVQVFPDSKFVREASLGLARALRHLGYDKQAFQIVDYIEKRWPRFYIEFPPFLRLLGDAAYKVENYDKAKNDYWTYYNIDPKGDEADIILARLGDIYVRTNRPGAAREMYDKAVADFPDREGGLISRMRLAEEGIYDEPSLDQMFTVFDRPLNMAPAKIYEDIVANYADSPLAPLAQLKLAMWQLWNNKNLDSLAAVLDFEKKFPESPLGERAREVGLKAFGSIVAQLVRDENYPKIVSLWNDYGFVRDMVADLSPQAKIALGLSFWKRGMPAQALSVVRPFINEEQVPEHSEVAMSLALSIYADNAKWNDVLGVAEAVNEWELRPDFKRELIYAKALALENLGRFEESRPLWVELGSDQKLDKAQRAYAIFFLAQEALAGKRLREAYDYAQDAYEMLVEQGGDQAKIRDTLNILIDVTERSARYREALKWATQLEELTPEDDPSWSALRYRMAGFYRKASDLTKWREMLGELAKKQPDALYGRMAASDLQLEKIEQAAREYSPPGAF